MSKASKTRAKSRPKSKASSGTDLTAAQRKRLQDLQKEVAHWQRQGVFSLGKLQNFIRLALEEGKSMSEVAGRAATPEYTEVMQAVLDLGEGRANNREGAPKLMKTVAQRGHGRKRTIVLTAKGRRLRDRLLQLKKS